MAANSPSSAATDEHAAASAVDDWVERETVDGAFKDERLGRRFKTLLADIGGAIGASLPLACQDWANTKAAYRFLANERVDESDILSGHFAATTKRFAATDGMILVLQVSVSQRLQGFAVDERGLSWRRCASPVTANSRAAALRAG